MMETFARFGLPKEVVSDNGPPFTAKEVEDFMSQNGIIHTFSAPYHPASNGAAEGAVKLCKRALKKATREGVELDVALQSFLLNYRNSVHSTTGETPAIMLQKRALRCRLDILAPAAAVEQRVREAQRKQTERVIDKPLRRMCSGDPVWMQEFRGNRNWVPGVVSEEKGTRNFLVTREDGTTGHRHVDQLKERFVLAETGEPGGGEIDAPTPLSPAQNLTSSSEARQEATGPAQTSIAINPPVPDHLVERKRFRKPPVRYGFEID